MSESAGDSIFQLGLHLRPLVIQNAEVDAVADPSGPGDYVAAECALFFGADAENRVARLLVQRIRFQFNPRASPDFKGMAQHQVFRFGVDRRALPRRRDPGRADLDSPVDAVDVHEPRAANYAPRSAFDRGKHNRLAALLFGEGFVDQPLEV